MLHRVTVNLWCGMAGLSRAPAAALGRAAAVLTLGSLPVSESAEHYDSGQPEHRYLRLRSAPGAAGTAVRVSVTVGAGDSSRMRVHAARHLSRAGDSAQTVKSNPNSEIVI